MTKQVVITGIGAVTPLGIGRAPFWEALLKGESGIRPASLYNTSDESSRMAAEVPDFDAARLLERKGLQYLSRSMALACVGAKLALDDAEVTVTDENRSRIGVVYGTALTGLNTGSRFDQQALLEGPRFVNPMNFPTTGPSAPACQVSIMFRLEAFNATLTNGHTSSLDAVNYGVNFIRSGRADMVLAGGVEEACWETFLGYSLSGALAHSEGKHNETSAPFDKRRNGLILGEGSAVLLLEDYEHAVRRGARIYATVGGYGTAFDPLSENGYDEEARGASEAMRDALEAAGVAADEVGLICANANSGLKSDRMEARAIRSVFGEEPRAALTAIKSMIGESCGAGGAFGAAVAALALSEGRIPPTINYTEPDPECPVPTLATAAREARPGAALVNAFGWNGSNASLLLTR